MSDESSWDPSNLTYPTTSNMYQTMEEKDELFGSSSTHTLSISNEYIETGMNMSNIHAKIVKLVKINQ